MNPNIKSKGALLDESTAVAQKAANTIGGSFTQGSYNTSGNLVGGFTPDVPKSITSNDLQNNTQPISLPSTTPPPTTSSGISASVESKITNGYNDLQNELKQQQTNAQSALDTTTGKLQSLFGDKQKILEERIASQQTPEFLEKKKASDEAYKAIQASRASQMAEIESLKTQGLVGPAATNALNAINQKYAFSNAQLSLTYDIANKDYSSAVDSINNLAQLKSEALQPQIDYYSKFLDSNMDNLTKSEQNILQVKLDQFKTQQTQETENIKANGDAMIKYNSLGAGITINDTPQQRAQKIANVGGLTQTEIIDNQYKQAQIANINSQIAERNNVGGSVQTLTGKPQNASQSAANGYADRLNESNIVIDNIGGKFTGTFAIGGSLPNVLQSGERQSYEQAKRNFITAVLRRESGAAISPSEFDTEAKKYFPQAGDKPETIIQKSNARNTAINNVYREANVARPVLPGMIIESEGKRYRVASDGETLEQI